MIELAYLNQLQLGAIDVRTDEYTNLITNIIEEEYLIKQVDSEFEDLDNCDKPFRTEFAFESITERNSRFKNRRSDG